MDSTCSWLEAPFFLSNMHWEGQWGISSTLFEELFKRRLATMNIRKQNTQSSPLLGWCDQHVISRYCTRNDWHTSKSIEQKQGEIDVSPVYSSGHWPHPHPVDLQQVEGTTSRFKSLECLLIPSFPQGAGWYDLLHHRWWWWHHFRESSRCSTQYSLWLLWHDCLQGTSSTCKCRFMFHVSCYIKKS